MMKFLLTILFGSIFVTMASSQTMLSGKVVSKDESKPVFGVNILVKNPQTLANISFGVTGEDGGFSLKVNADTDSLLLVFKSLTTQEKQVSVINQTQEVLVEVQEAVQEIPEFTLKSIKNPVSAKNDTISYSVEGFATPNDRVIADILKRLPGIEVQENGRILYEGRGIQKFYIEGMDLLEGKYNLASKNLPADAVESVQILENHQPLRVLDSLVFSDRASLNLKLKKKNVWIGTGNAGLGASPLLWEGKFSPMVFRNNLQMINTMQSNNSGRDIAQELEVLTLEDLKERVGNQEEYRPWFGIPELFVPSVQKERFLFNESHLVSANVLKRNPDQTDFRANIAYLHDSQRQTGLVQTAFFLPMDTVRILEEHQNRYLNRDLDAELSWIKNEKRAYLKNRLQLNLQNNVEFGLTNLNGVPRSQKANLPLVSISNKFHTLTPVGRQLLDVKSNVSFRQAYQDLSISPGGFEQQLSDGAPIERLVQGVEYQSFFANNSVGFTKGIGKGWTFSSKTGVLYQRDVMESRLGAWEGNEVILQGIPYTNDLTYQEIKPYLQPKFNLKQESFNFTFDFPVSYLNVNVEDPLLGQGQRLGRMVWEPQLLLNYHFTGKWNSALSLRRKNEFKGIQDLHYGYVLRNYRSFQQKATEVPEVLNHSLTYRLNFKDPINSFFASLNYTYSLSDYNTILENQVEASGEVVYRTLDLANRGENHSLHFRSSKYLPLLFTNMTLSGIYQNRKSEQVINGDLSNVEFEVLGPALEISVNPKSVVNLSYKADLNFIHPRVEEGELGRIRQFKHVAGLDIFPYKDHLLTVSWEHYDNRLEDQKDLTGFLDLRYKYRISQSKWDVNLHAQNILNNNNVGTFSADTFMIRQRTFLLRPRQVLLSLNFTF